MKPYHARNPEEWESIPSPKKKSTKNTNAVGEEPTNTGHVTDPSNPTHAMNAANSVNVVNADKTINAVKDTNTVNITNTDHRTGYSNRVRFALTTTLLWLFLTAPPGQARVCWYDSNVHAVTGTENVLLLTHFVLPCEGGRSLFNDARLTRQFKLTEKFTMWCEEFTAQLLDDGMKIFCPDVATDVPRLAEKVQQRISHFNFRPRSRNEGIYARIKRFILEIFTVVVVAVVGLTAGYMVSKSYTGQSNVEDVARNNLVDMKALANETQEL